jgi:hypothetical protein
MNLAFDVSRRCLVLRIQGVKILIKALVEVRLIWLDGYVSVALSVLLFRLCLQCWTQGWTHVTRCSMT